MTTQAGALLSYDEALAYIASLAPRGWRLGLDRMDEFVRRLGVTDAIGRDGPPRFLHVAGTNGKGSVTAYLHSMLVESGYRTGAFYSPYVYDIRERVQFGRRFIYKPELARLTTSIHPIAEAFTGTELGGISEFEFKTGLAFAFWKERACEWVALEVGLGGRLDATNVVTSEASAIVSIGLDHVSILGDTHAQIAAEKAGIIKRGKPVVVGEMPAPAREVVLRHAKEQGATAWVFGREIAIEPERSGHHYTVRTPARTHTHLRPGLVGTVQPHNMALAVAMLDAGGAFRNEEAVQTGVRRASLPGRFERRLYHGCDVVLDGAHNVEAAEVLVDTLRLVFPGRRLSLVTSMVAGHEPGRFYGPLKPLVETAHVAPVQLHRAMPPEEVAAALDRLGIPVETHASVGEALWAASREAQDGHLIVVTGSFYLVGEAARLLV